MMPTDHDYNASNDICFQPIGLTKNSFDETSNRQEMKKSDSWIAMNEEWVGGLEGLEVGQTLLVLFYFDRTPDEISLLQHPRGDTSRPKRGVFALRSPHRPNPIGATQVTLLAIEGNMLKVRGLDAYDQTPVLDLKPGR